MSGPEVLDVARDALMTLVLVASPLMPPAFFRIWFSSNPRLRT